MERFFNAVNTGEVVLVVVTALSVDAILLPVFWKKKEVNPSRNDNVPF